MRLKIVLVTLCIFFVQGCEPRARYEVINEPEQDIVKIADEETGHKWETLADFSNIYHWMLYDEAMALLGVPIDDSIAYLEDYVTRLMGGDFINVNFNLIDGSNMFLQFTLWDNQFHLFGMGIVDFAGGAFWQTDEIVPIAEEVIGTHTVSDFINVKYYMTYTEVIELIGTPDSVCRENDAVYKTFTYYLSDGSRMSLGFLRRNILKDIHLIDTGGRVFSLARTSTMDNQHIDRQVQMRRDPDTEAPTISSFADIEYGMEFREVFRILDAPDYIDGRFYRVFPVVTYYLYDGSIMRMSFFREKLTSMDLFDAPR
jgi:hypothetical protein